MLSLEAFFVLEMKIFKCFSPYMGMAAILFNNAERFEQMNAFDSRPNMISCENWSSFLEKKNV